MSSIALASQRYSDLLSRPMPAGDRFQRWRAFPGTTLCECLEIDVIPVAEQLWTSPAFQDLALLPLVTLLPGCETRERSLVGELKQAIMYAVEQTRSFVEEHRPLLDEHYAQSVDRWRRLNSLPPALVDSAPVPNVTDALQTLERIARRCEDEWASAEDYFGPHFDTYAKEEGMPSLQRGEFIIDFSRELQYVGNFVARCLLVRAVTTINLLAATTNELNVALVAARASLPQPWRGQQLRIRQLLANLRRACLHTPEAIEAEAATSMVQIAIEFSARTPDVSWLPPDATRFANRAWLRHALHGKRDLITGQIIQEALATLQKWSARRTQYDSSLDEAIATGGLVVVEASREVYWKGSKLNVDWHRQQNKQWQFLLLLAKTRGRRFVSEYDLYGERDVTPGALRVVKRRLIRQLPIEFKDLIIDIAESESGYQLRLPSQAIHLFLD